MNWIKFVSLSLFMIFANQAFSMCKAIDPNGPFSNFCRTMNDSEQRCSSYPNQCVWMARFEPGSDENIFDLIEYCNLAWEREDLHNYICDYYR